MTRHDDSDSLLAEAFERYLAERAAGRDFDMDAFCADFARTAGEREARVLRKQIEDDLIVHDGLGVLRRNLGSALRLDPEPPERIGPYHFIRPLGEGGMGAVYLAEQRRPVRREVAVKLIKLGMDSRRMLRRFEYERQTIARMQHSAIARVFDAGTTDSGQPYFVMEYVRGSSITAYSKEHALSVKARIRLFQRVCLGVEHAHRRGVIHRDLKPSNILIVDEDGGPQPKIIDFGLAKATDDSDRGEIPATMTREGQALGTPEYMSPEQTGLVGQDVDTRADVYSLGVILYELVTGELPIGSDADGRQASRYAMCRRVCEEQPIAPSQRVRQRIRQGEVGPDAPVRLDAKLHQKLRSDLDWICLKAIEKDRERRYASPEALADDLKRFLTHQPVDARAPSAIYWARKFARKYRVLVSAVAMVLVSLLTGLIVAVRFYYEARANVIEKEETLATVARLARIPEEILEHGDHVPGGWHDGFESYADEWPTDRTSGQFELPTWEIGAPSGNRTDRGWFRAGDLKSIYLVRNKDGASGNFCLRLYGNEPSEVAAIGHRVDRLHGRYVPEFTLSMRIRCDGACDGGVSLVLNPAPISKPLMHPNWYDPREGRILISTKNIAGRSFLATALNPAQEDWRELAKGMFQKLEISYRRLSAEEVVVTATLDGDSIPDSRVLAANAHEESLTWLTVNASECTIWIDDVEVRRSLPHVSWHFNPRTRRCYVLTPRLTFDEAREWARKRNGDLVVIENLAERNWLRRTFGPNDLLIGLYRQRDMRTGDFYGPWRWLKDSGMELRASEWNDGVTPSGANLGVGLIGGYEDPVTRPRRGSGALVATDSDTRLPAIVEFERDHEPTRDSFGALAGDLDWVHSLGGQSFTDEKLPEDPSIVSVAADHSPDNRGGFVLCGTFVRRAKIGSRATGLLDRAVIASSSGGKDAFIAKCNNRCEILWTRLIGGAGDDRGRSVAVHTDGSVLVAGSFSARATVRAAGAAKQMSSLTSAGGADAFVARFGADGDLHWITRGGGPEDDCATGIACSKTGSVFVSATLASGGTFVRDQIAEPRDQEQAFHGKTDIALACFDLNGRLRWYRIAGGAEADQCNGVATLSDGSAVITGGFQGTATFGDDSHGTELISKSGATSKKEDGREFNIFVARYLADGRMIWVRHEDGPGGRSMGHAIATGSRGGFYITGAIDAHLAFGAPRPSFSSALAELAEVEAHIDTHGLDPESVARHGALLFRKSLGWVDVFLTKYDITGKAIWTTSAGGADGSNIGYGLSVTQAGDVLVTGQLQGACVFGQNEPYQTLRSSYSIERTDPFLACYRSDTGMLQWARTARGPVTNWGSGVAALDDGHAVVVGGFSGPITFGEGEPAQTTLVPGGAYVARFRLRDR